jgi:hypothetical protein
MRIGRGRFVMPAGLLPVLPAFFPFTTLFAFASRLPVSPKEKLLQRHSGGAERGGIAFDLARDDHGQGEGLVVARRGARQGDGGRQRGGHL